MRKLSFLSEPLRRLGAVGTNHPTAFFALGVTGVLTSTVMACRATLALEGTIAQFEDPPTEEEAARNRIRAGVAVVRLYAPAFAVGAASVVMLTKSHSTLVKRNAALSAAYTALDNGFRDYRLRVVEKYGLEEDDLLRYGHETETTRKGNRTVKTHKVAKFETGSSIYAVFFDEYNPNWSEDPEYNKVYLRSMQNYFNDLLHARGHLFLNEVYNQLGFPHTQAGSVVGWVMSPDGDNYVDLGIFNSLDPDRVRDFVNGREGSVLLDFNVDGVIYDKLGSKPALKWQGDR